MNLPFSFSLWEQILLGGMVFLFMFAIGAGLHPHDFRRCLENKRVVAIGLAFQYGLMPLLALLCSLLLGLPNEAYLVLLIIGASPGGTSSNMFSFLNRANLSLSVSLTLISSLFAVLISPLLIRLYAQGLDVSIPWKNLVGTLGASLFPILLGMLLKVKKPSWAIYAEYGARKLGLFVVLIMIALWIPKLWGLIGKDFNEGALATGLMSLSGMLISYFGSRLIGVGQADRRAISFETGIQNAPLAFGVIGLSFGAGHEVLPYAWLALVYGALSIANGITMTCFFKLRDLVK